MSGQSYRDYGARYESVKGLVSDDAEERRQAEEARKLRIGTARADIGSGREIPVPKRNADDVYDRSAVKNAITEPSAKADRLRVVLIDNSGSNRTIAEHLKKSSGHFLSLLKIVDPGSEVACVYFSDHCDRDGLMQEVDYVAPTVEGDKVMHSSLRHVYGAHGGDAPEAIECALWRACDVGFGKIPVADRHLYLVTDVVGHGMGMSDDQGCPEQRNWKQSLKRVAGTYGSFEVIGSGEDPGVAKLQMQFLAADRVKHDLIDLSEIKEHQHRCAITGNALLFLIARERGPQAVTAFLAALYEKWLAEPIFGANTDLSAKAAIRRFGKYLELPEAQIKKMMDTVLV